MSTAITQQSYTRAAIMPDGINVESRTVPATWGTETKGVTRYDWERDRRFIEVLSFDPGHIRTERMDQGLPMLDNHDQWRGSEGVIGIAENVHIESGRGLCDLRFDDDEKSNAVFEKVRKGIIKGVSVGYRVYQYRMDGYDEESGVAIYRAEDWEPMEISIAPIPADVESGIGRDAAVAAWRGTTVIEPEGENKKEQRKSPEGGESANNERKKNMSAENQNPAPPIDEAKLRAEILAQEQARTTGILETTRKMKLDDEFAQRHIADGTSLEEVRAQAIEEWSKKDPAKPEGQRGGGQPKVTGRDEKDKIRSGIAAAIIQRGNARVNLTDQERTTSRDFGHLSLQGMIREVIRSNGGNPDRMSLQEQFRSVTGRGNDFGSYETRMMNTADFANITENVLGKALRAEYELAERTFTIFAQKGSVPDFKIQTRVQLGDASALRPVVEGGEYEYGQSTDAKESLQAFKYGRMIALTYEAFRNDDLGAFTRLPVKVANQVAQLQSNLFYTHLLANGNMGDGNALFSSAHGNLGTAGAPSATTLKEMYKKMREQKSLGDGTTGSGDYLNIAPEWILGGPEQEDAILRQMVLTNPDTTTNANIYAGRLKPIIEPRITGTKWYGIGRPGAVDTIEYGGLEGEPEIYIETFEDPKVDGMSWKVRNVFYVKALDWRNLYYNAGS